MRYSALLMLLPLLAACDVHSKNPVDADDNVTIQADNSGHVAFNLPFAEGQVKVPAGMWHGGDVDLDGVKLMPGSSVTGFRWKDNAPFDADGPGTSDLDLTLMGPGVLDHYVITGYYVPGVHTRPLSDFGDDVAPDLVPLRKRLMEMVQRPVNIQGTRDWLQHFRGEVLDQPYLLLFGELETGAEPE